MAKGKILIVDDEDRIRDMIKEYISQEGYDVVEASDGAEALDRFKAEPFDLIILDIMLPRVDGWSVCREIRKSSHIPVIMLTARGEEYDKLFGFDLGVDDYIVKPFSPKELLARMKAIIRRVMTPYQDGEGDNRMAMGGVVIDLDSRNVYVDGILVSLTPKEYELLSFLVRNPNRVLSRDRLLTDVWGYDFTGDDRTVDTHVKMLRETLGPYRHYIVTVWGTGYKFEASAPK